MFFVLRIHFHYVLSYLFGLFGVRTCVSILWHTSLPKNATFAWKNSEKPWFWRFSVIFMFWHDVTYDVTVTSYKVCLYFFWYQWTREGHSYPLVPNTWCFVNRFPRSWGAESAPPPRLWDGSKKPGSFRVNSIDFPGACAPHPRIFFVHACCCLTLYDYKIIMLHWTVFSLFG